MRRMRGKEMAMVFQDSMTSLDPVYRIVDQIIEVLRIHGTVNKKEVFQRAVELLRLVGLPDPEMRCMPARWWNKGMLLSCFEILNIRIPKDCSAAFPS